MPKKSVIKKKAFQAHCKKQNRSGLVNKEDGTWTRPGGRTETSDEMALKGAVH